MQACGVGKADCGHVPVCQYYSTDPDGKPYFISKFPAGSSISLCRLGLQREEVSAVAEAFIFRRQMRLKTIPAVRDRNRVAAPVKMIP